MEWSADDILKLISLYRQCECLWNFNDPHYKSIDIRTNAWNEIAREFEKDAGEIKKKIKNLRTAYVAEKKRVESSKKSSASKGSVHKPRLFYFKEFNFLESVVVLRKNPSYLISECFEDATKATDLDSSLQDEISFVELPSPSLPINDDTHMPSNSPSELSHSSIASKSSSCRKGRLRKKLRTEAKFYNAVDALVASVKEVKSEDIYSSFAKTISLQLQQLPLADATETMSEIHSLITSKILRHLRQAPKCAVRVKSISENNNFKC